MLYHLSQKTSVPVKITCHLASRHTAPLRPLRLEPERLMDVTRQQKVNSDGERSMSVLLRFGIGCMLDIYYGFGGSTFLSPGL